LYREFGRPGWKATSRFQRTLEFLLGAAVRANLRPSTTKAIRAGKGEYRNMKDNKMKKSEYYIGIVITLTLFQKKEFH
jgi:hypothetical protein